jgi:archaellum component FlaD/FlaE
VEKFGEVWEDEELWKGIDQNRALITVSKAILALMNQADTDNENSGGDEREEDEEENDKDEDEEEADNEEEEGGDDQEDKEEEEEEEVEEEEDAEMADEIDFGAPDGITLNLSRTYLANDLENLRALAAQALSSVKTPSSGTWTCCWPALSRER